MRAHARSQSQSFEDETTSVVDELALEGFANAERLGDLDGSEPDDDPGYLEVLGDAFGEDLSNLDLSFGDAGVGNVGALATAEGDALAFGSADPRIEQVAHEVTHAIQARRFGPGARDVSDPDEAAEREAKDIGSRVARGEPIPQVQARPTAAVQRDEDPVQTEETTNENENDAEVDATTLLSRLEACQGTFWDNEDGMFVLLENATVAELLALPDLEAWLAYLTVEQQYTIRQRVAASGESPDAPSQADAFAQRVADTGYTDTHYDSANDFLAMDPASRRAALEAIENNPDAVDNLWGHDLERFRAMAEGTEADAVEARMDMACGGAFDGTDESGVNAAYQKALALKTEADALEVIAAQDPAAQARLDEIGVEKLRRLLEPDSAFMEKARREIGSEALGQEMAQNAADPVQAAREQILGAEGYVWDDTTKMKEVLAALTPEQRDTLMQDPEVQRALDPMWGEGVSDATVEAMDEHGSFIVARARILETEDRSVLLKILGALTEQDRAKVQADAQLMAHLHAYKRWGLIDPASAEEWKELVDQALAGGVLNPELVLAQATDKRNSTELAVEGLAGMDPGDRERVQAGYLVHCRIDANQLSESDLSDDQRHALAVYRMLMEGAEDFGDAARDQVLGAAVGAQDPALLKTPEGRRDLVDTLYFRQTQRLEVGGGVGSQAEQDTLRITHSLFCDVYEPLKGKAVEIDAAVRLVSLDQQFWEAAEAERGAARFWADIGSSVAAAVICVGVGVLTGGTAAPGLFAALGGTYPAIGAAAAGAVAKAGTAELIGGDHVDGQDAVKNAISGSLEVLTGAVGGKLAAGAVAGIGKSSKPLLSTFRTSVREASNAAAGRSVATGALEGAIDGAIGGAVGDGAMTAMDAETYKRGLWVAIGRVGSSALQGLVLGAATGGVIGGAAKPLRTFGEMIGVAKPHPNGAAFRQALDDHLDALGVKGASATEVHVVDDVYELVGSRTGVAFLHVEGDSVWVIVRKGATVDDLKEEAVHLAQRLDPETSAKFGRIYDQVPDPDAWKALDAVDKKQAMLDKLDLEIDAQQRLADLAEEGDAVDLDTLDVLLERRIQLQGTDPQDLETLPWWDPDQPPWLFRKVKIDDPNAVDRFDHGHERPTDLTDPRSTLKLQEGEKLQRIGEEWVEGTDLKPDQAGRVSAIEGGVIHVDSDGTVRPYAVGEGATIDVEVGAEVTRDTRLSRESRRYRLVQAVAEDGTVRTKRAEILMPDGRWIQRGSDNNLRGEIAEEAADMDIRARSQAAVDAGEIDDFIMLETQNRSGQGFDNARIELTRTEHGYTAEIFVTEVKDYPNRYVPANEFTAIGENLKTNWEELVDSIQKQTSQHDEDVREAVEDALFASAPVVEIRVTASTLVGASGPRNAESLLRAQVRQALPNATLVRADCSIDEYLEEASETVAARRR